MPRVNYIILISCCDAIVAPTPYFAAQCLRRGCRPIQDKKVLMSAVSVAQLSAVSTLQRLPASSWQAPFSLTLFSITLHLLLVALVSMFATRSCIAGQLCFFLSSSSPACSILTRHAAGPINRGQLMTSYSKAKKTVTLNASTLYLVS